MWKGQIEDEIVTGTNVQVDQLLNEPKYPVSILSIMNQNKSKRNAP